MGRAGNRLWEALMVLNRVSLAAFGVMVLAWSGLSVAQQYRPTSFLSLDPTRAVLSPKPLGPATSFTPGPLDVRIDRGKDAAPSTAEFVVDPKIVPAATVHAENKPRANPRTNRPLEPRSGRSRPAGAWPMRARNGQHLHHAPRALVALARAKSDRSTGPRHQRFRSGPAEPAASATGSDSGADAILI